MNGRLAPGLTVTAFAWSVGFAVGVLPLLAGESAVVLALLGLATAFTPAGAAPRPPRV